MSALPATLAALDFTPAPVECGLCSQLATWRLRLSCGCVALECERHAAQMVNHAAHYATVCHVHRVYGVDVAEIERIQP